MFERYKDVWENNKVVKAMCLREEVSEPGSFGLWNARTGSSCCSTPDDEQLHCIHICRCSQNGDLGSLELETHEGLPWESSSVWILAVVMSCQVTWVAGEARECVQLSSFPGGDSGAAAFQPVR